MRRPFPLPHRQGCHRFRDKSVRAWGFEKLSTWGFSRNVPTRGSDFGRNGGGRIGGGGVDHPKVRGAARTWKNLGYVLGVEVMRGNETKVALAIPPDVTRSTSDDNPWENHDGAYDEDLLAQLRGAWWKMAQAATVPAYVVASNRTLLAIATMRPTSENALSNIPGMGRHE